MSESVNIVVVKHGELRERACPSGLIDPHAILDPEPAHRAALLSNPLCTSDDDPVQVLAVAGQTIAGRIDVIPGIIRLAQPDGTRADIRVLWGSSWFVPPEFRNTMAALMIIMKWQALWPAAAVVGISQMALPIYEKLKWVNVPMSRSVLICKSRPVVERYIGAGALGAVARIGADVGLFAHGVALKMWRRGPRSRLKVVPLQLAPQAWDEPLARISDSPTAGVARSTAWTNWLLSNTFGGNSIARTGLFAVRDGDGRDLACFIVKDRLYETATARQFRNLHLGTLIDWAIFDELRISELDVVALAAGELRRRGVDAIEVCSTNEALGASLRRVGFVGAGQLAFMFRSPPKGPLGRDDLKTASAWRVRPSDGDNFFA